ncbi:M48 family metallopeptidase [Sulfurovum sp. NBC37-1]|uniref:M48 family metallopeptidase n=1 Tax=Sulfurovum sp. (strain NBC37-1) TaxID=387093 RepID=UPI0001587684|nr:M48 family metallopeptidase [Sulfurovum sp. NBC37-1]BAF71564.1 zinc metallopeptidase [Sulfurovum sp. NBC37-1]
MLEIIVGLYTLYTLMKLYISFMQVGYINQEKRKDPVLMPAGKYLVAANYAVAKEKLGIIETFVDYLMFLWWVFAGFAWLSSLFQVDGGVTSSVFFLFGFVAVNYVVGLPFSLYQTFKIDEDFGFNKMTPKTFIVDALKSAGLFIVLGGAVFAVLAWIISLYETWWLWGFILMFAIAVAANLLMPFFMGLFNKFSPLEEGELKDAIVELMQKAGLKSDGIFVMDASKRDSRLNAFFGGLGKSKRVVLYDTLLDKLNKKELLAVLGHELGHFSHGDIWKNIALMGLLLFIAFYLFGHLPESLFIQMGVSPYPGVQIAMLMLLLPLLSFIFTPFMSYVSRHNEYAADEYGSQMGGKENLVSALLKLITENKAFPKSHPLVIFFYHTHPPVIERLKELGYDASNVVIEEEKREEPSLPNDGIFAYMNKENL